MSTIEANKQLARDYFAAFSSRDEAWWSQLIAPGFRRHDPGLSDPCQELVRPAKPGR